MPLKHAGLFNALIRTHHITSRKKIAKLRHAAGIHDCFVLLHTGKCPGVMYCEGSESGVRSWVAVVQGLRYKDYALVARPSPAPSHDIETPHGKVVELSSVKDFSAHMETRNLLPWWRKGMGYL